MNKILYTPLIAIGFCLVICVFALIEHSQNSMVLFGLCTVLLLLVLWMSMDNFWIYRRMKAMSPDHFKTLKTRFNTVNHTIDLSDNDNNITFFYNTRKKLFYAITTMYTNPKRYSKEYEERKYQFQTRMKQTQIPLEVIVTPQESTIRFCATVCLMKHHATPENICKVRAIFADLSKEDYNEHIFSKFLVDDDTLYLETFHIDFVRALLVKTDGTVERLSVQEEISEESARLAHALYMVRNHNQLEQLKPQNMIEAEEFEQIWGNNAL